MPIKTNEKKLDYKSQHLNKISNLKTAVKQKFNLVKKKHYTRQYLALGISMGLCFGLPFAVAIGNIALGPALGIPIGANDHRFPPPITKFLKSISVFVAPLLLSALTTPNPPLIQAWKVIKNQLDLDISFLKLRIL